MTFKEMSHTFMSICFCYRLQNKACTSFMHRSVKPNFSRIYQILEDAVLKVIKTCEKYFSLLGISLRSHIHPQDSSNFNSKTEIPNKVWIDQSNIWKISTG